MRPAVRLESVTKVFGAGETAVRAVVDAHLEVAPGEVVLVMGPSGAGKTTLLTMIGGLLRPTAGRIWVCGAEITALDEKQLPAVRLHRVGFVFQSFNLLANLTVTENVRVVLEATGVRRGEADMRTRQLLGSLGLGGRLDVLPEQLSGGEKQRVAIARAVVHDPDLVLADEPTGNLDSAAGRQAVDLLAATAKQKGRSVVCVTHDHRITDVADRVLWLEDGKLMEHHPAASGPPPPPRRPSPSPGPGSVDELITVMEDILRRMEDTDDGRRHFHATYLRTTKAVKDELHRGGFIDAAWVDRWDVRFAQLYLDALEQWDRGETPSAPWIVAFEAAGDPRLPPLRQVLLGMNAHINYDLPQALLDTIPPGEFDDAEVRARRHRDHRHIDAILVARVVAEDRELVAVERPGDRAAFDRLLTPLNRVLTMRLIREARRLVWNNATQLHRARLEGPGSYGRRLRQLEALSAARVTALRAPGPVILRLSAQGFGVSLDGDTPRRGDRGAPSASS